MRLRIYGRVQFTGLRKKIKKFCLENGINGYVKNVSDGSVLISIDRKSESFIEWLKTNPGFSKIKEINIENPHDEFSNEFEIKKDFGYFYDQFKAFGNFVFLRQGLEKVPIHLAIIPDGNRRWAKARGLEGFNGHERAGEFDNLISLFDEAKNLGVRYVSFWGFSTENWKREKEENDKLFNVFLKGIEAFREYAKENKVRFRHVGRKDRFNNEVRDSLIKIEEETRNYSDFNINLCLDYGGRDEILRGVNKLLGLKARSVNEMQFSGVLDTKGVPDVELIIRTSGEKRLSGFMPYQGVYAELLFVKKHFPDFKVKDILKAVKEFSLRKRRFGGN